MEVTIPPHTAPSGSTVEVKVQPGFAPSDVFVMPEGIQSASPSYLISSEGSADLNEVTISMEHHVGVSTREEASNLVFLQADPVPRQSASGYVYEYQEVSAERSEFTLKENIGRLIVKALRKKLYKVGLKIKKWLRGTRSIYATQ